MYVIFELHNLFWPAKARPETYRSFRWQDKKTCAGLHRAYAFTCFSSFKSARPTGALTSFVRCCLRRAGSGNGLCRPDQVTSEFFASASTSLSPASTRPRHAVGADDGTHQGVHTHRAGSKYRTLETDIDRRKATRRAAICATAPAEPGGRHRQRYRLRLAQPCTSTSGEQHNLCSDREAGTNAFSVELQGGAAIHYIYRSQLSACCPTTPSKHHGRKTDRPDCKRRDGDLSPPRLTSRDPELHLRLGLRI